MDTVFNARAEAKKIEDLANTCLREQVRTGQSSSEYYASELVKEAASFWGDKDKRASVGAALKDDLKDKSLGFGTLLQIEFSGEAETASIAFDKNSLVSVEFALYKGLNEKHGLRIDYNRLYQGPNPELDLKLSTITGTSESEVVSKSAPFVGAQMSKPPQLGEMY